MKKTQNANRTGKKVTMLNDSNVLNMIKSIIFGPIVAVFAIGLIYVVWWAMSSAFNLLHSWMSTSVLSWITGAWPYVVGIWAFVLVTSIAVPFIAGKVKKIKEEVKASKDHEIEEEILTR